MVAVKVAIDERCADEGFRRSFPDQTRMSAVIDHPNVLPVFHSGEHAGRPYLVMPHVFGVDLARQIAAQALTVRRVLALLGQVAAGLDAMHRCGLCIWTSNRPTCWWAGPRQSRRMPVGASAR